MLIFKHFNVIKLKKKAAQSKLDVNIVPLFLYSFLAVLFKDLDFKNFFCLFKEIKFIRPFKLKC